MGKISSKLITVLYIIAFFAIIMVCFALQNTDYMCKIDRPSNFVLFLPGLVCACILFIIKADTVQTKPIWYWLTSITCIVLCIFQFLAIKNYYFHAGWDVYFLEEVINSKIDNLPYSAETINYFSIYPNNLFLCSIYYLIEKFYIAMGFWYGNRHLSLLFVNCCICQLSAFLTFWCTSQITKSQNVSILSFVLFQLLIGLSPWFSITYSDSFGIIFPILMLSIYLIPSKQSMFNYLKWLLIGFLSFCAYSIKPQCCFVSISIVLISLINYNYKSNTIRQLSVEGTMFLLGIIVSVALVNKCISILAISIDRTKSFGLTHFLMMGLNTSSGGMWSGEDYAFSNSLSSSIRAKLELAETSSRLKNLGIGGLMKHFAKKTLSTFNDGSFAWWKEGKFLAGLIPESNSWICWTLRNIFYSEGAYFSIWTIICQAIWLPILVTSSFLPFSKKKPLSTKIIELSLIGVFIYNLLLEPRARYLLVNLPFFVIAASVGFNTFKEKVSCVFATFKRK